jgi:hypothetical protein
MLYQTREYILSGKAIDEYCLFSSPYYFTPLSENRVKNAMFIPRGNLTRFMTSCKLNTNPFKHLKRIWLYLSAKLIKLGSERCYFPDIYNTEKRRDNIRRLLFPTVYIPSFDIASCYWFSCCYRFSNIAINSVNPSFRTIKF